MLLGAGTGDLLRNEEYYFALLTEGIDRTRPTWIHHHFSNAPVDVLAQHFDLQGARSCVVAACSSSTIAIGQAADLILDGELDAAICGGTDALARLTFSGFNALRLMDPEPCKPFDKARAGDEHRRGRGDAGARGHGAGQGARRHDLRRAGRLRAVLRGVSRDRARSPRAGPSAGRWRARSRAPAWPPTRSTTSTATAPRRRRTIAPRPAACTSSSATAPAASRSTRSSRWSATASGPPARSRPRCSALTIKRGVIPPTIHHDTTDPECDVDVVANTAREVPVRCGVSTSLAFGGNDAALVMRAVCSATLSDSTVARKPSAGHPLEVAVERPDRGPSVRARERGNQEVDEPRSGGRRRRRTSIQRSTTRSTCRPLAPRPGSAAMRAADDRPRSRAPRPLTATPAGRAAPQHDHVGVDEANEVVAATSARRGRAVAATHTDVSTTITIRGALVLAPEFRRDRTLNRTGPQRRLQFVRATAPHHLPQGVDHGVRLGPEAERRPGLLQQAVPAGSASCAYALMLRRYASGLQ